ncbi:DUF6221 family protein [Geodermatophilus ruber]|uniref:Uncharacterized protein n=1 Tax=Geodermatophilus ruber TaxID=504800 RepID=A0A1I3Z2U0_9ACTN|nr:DUF6221 family protein [Geodermatophilus ruber]SFK38350.1 hypothetical protein SAMN04488085_101318 [Geodermatophilus ruber]
MENLPAFLLARITEDESAARAAVKVIDSRETAGWYWSGAGDAVFLDGTSVPVACGPWKQLMDQASARHIVRNDPERVLAECDAKRRILSAHRSAQDAVTATARDDPTPSERLGAVEALGLVLRFMAVPYADHPEYNPEWMP